MAVGSKAQFVARAVAWPVAPVVFVLMAADPVIPLEATDVPYAAAILACWAVGVVLTVRAFEQPAGWAFLGLGTALVWSGYTDQLADDHPLVAVFGDSSFVWWFMFLALGLQFTPMNRSTSRLWRALPAVTIGSACLFQLGALFRSQKLEGTDDVSPWAIESIAGLIAAFAAAAILTLAVCLLLSVYALVKAFRRARGEERQQLLWLVAGAATIAPCVIASFAASYAGHDDAAGWIMSICIVALALGAGFSVAKYRLYDVERVVGESVSYALASGAVIVVFGLVVVVITRSIPSLSSTARWPISVATLAAAGVARPAYLWARNAVDRRFNRRRFDAVQVVRSGLRRPGIDVEILLREALGDPRARLVFPAQGGGWVTSSGHVAEPAEHTVDVVRDRGVSARIEFDPHRTESHVVEAVGHEAAAEIDNLGLRAELARQVEQITESRARLAGAHLEERQRIERDLHDGAQQRILAIALQLRSARVNGADDALREEVDRAIADLGLTVQELRDLAGGLQPAALAGGGLRAAVEDLASRIPIGIDLEVVDCRFQPNVETAAWFVVAEAVANAVKHADVDRLSIRVTNAGPHLDVDVTDAGVGGANPRGSGLQGLADRVAALGGSLTVSDHQPHGTRVKARFPCG